MSKCLFACFFSLSILQGQELHFERIANHELNTVPYQWAMIDQLFDSKEAADLAANYPIDHYKTVNGYDGEKGYQYEVRSLIHMGEKQAAFSDSLSPSWQRLAQDLLSDEYRKAMSQLTGIDLSSAPMEVNIFQYGPGAWMGPHVDLKDKIVTHVLYFNSEWDSKEGGCLAILRSKNILDEVCLIPPIVGNSALIVRSNHSWHSVLPIAATSHSSRKSVTVTFYHPRSVSTMWPPGEIPLLHDYPH